MYYNSKNLNLAKNMRSNMTREELKFWCVVRAKNFYGYKFKRQVLVGDYIVDFLCPEKRVIVEIDGGQHNEESNINADNERTLYLESQGYKIIRFWNNEIYENIEGVCERLRIVLDNM